MQRPLLINGFLLVLVLILGGVVWFSIQDRQSDQRIPLTQLQPDQINLITLENQNGSGMRLERRGDNWAMQRPYKVTANGSRIGRLLEITRSRSASRFRSPENLTEFGLTTPLATLTLNQTRIEVGTTHPMNQRRYLRIGEQIHLIKDRFIHHLQAAVEDFISPLLLPEGSRIMAISTPEWQLSLTTGSRASLTPSNPGISRDDLNRKGDQWRLARASRVVPAPEAKSSDRVEIQLQERQQPISFEINRSTKHTLLIRRELGLAYVLPKGSGLLNFPTSKDK